MAEGFSLYPADISISQPDFTPALNHVCNKYFCAFMNDKQIDTAIIRGAFYCDGWSENNC